MILLLRWIIPYHTEPHSLWKQEGHKFSVSRKYGNANPVNINCLHDHNTLRITGIFRSGLPGYWEKPVHNTRHAIYVWSVETCRVTTFGFSVPAKNSGSKSESSVETRWMLYLKNVWFGFVLVRLVGIGVCRWYWEWFQEIFVYMCLIHSFNLIFLTDYCWHY